MLTLYDDPWSPNCVKVRLVLREIEAVMPLRWRSVPVDLDKGEQHEKRFLKVNPLGRVPVLVDGGMVLRESGAILVYLAERFDRARLLPRGGRDRAECLQWVFFQSTELGRVIADLYEEQDPEGDRHPDLVALWQKDLDHLIEVLDDHMRPGRRYLLGSHPTIADFAMVSSLDLLPDLGVDLAKWTRASAYLGRMHARPSWAGVWPAE
jgi:glutathione S-transferase